METSAAKKRHSEEAAAYATKRILDKINERLRFYGQAPFTKLGDSRKGEIELLGIEAEYPCATHVVIDFRCQWPGGEERNFGMIFDLEQSVVNDGNRHLRVGGAICLVTVNHEYFVFTKQHRQTLDGFNPWPVEVVRGFSHAEHGLPIGIPMRANNAHAPWFPALTQVSDLPLAVVGRKLAPLMLSGLVEFDSLTILGLSAKDSGISRNLNLIAVVNLTTTQMAAVLEEKGTKRMKIRFVSVSELYRSASPGVLPGFLEHGLEDALSTSALFYYEHLIYRPSKTS